MHLFCQSFHTTQWELFILDCFGRVNIFVAFLNSSIVYVCALTVIELRPGHEMFSFSCVKRADLLRNWLGTCQQSGSWEKTGKTQTRLRSGSNRKLNPHSSHSLFTLAWTCLTLTKPIPWGRRREAPPSVPHRTGWRRQDVIPFLHFITTRFHMDQIKTSVVCTGVFWVHHNS